MELHNLSEFEDFFEEARERLTLDTIARGISNTLDTAELEYLLERISIVKQA